MIKITSLINILLEKKHKESYIQTVSYRVKKYFKSKIIGIADKFI